jgi:transcriptional regulator with XRE-family HTH domain
LNPSRKVRLKAWLVLHEITAKSLADKLGISQQLLSMTLSGVRPDANRIDMLVQLGIPRELLPTPDRSRSS